MNLIEAINAVEAAATDLSNADSAQAAAQAKYEAALAGKNTADQADVDAITKFDGTLDVLIAAATAAKRGAPAPTV